jgi:hypothetical protein
VEQNKDPGKTVYLSAGELEGFDTITLMFKMRERLISRCYPGLKIEVELLDDETPMTAINPTVMRDLLFVMGK